MKNSYLIATIAAAAVAASPLAYSAPGNGTQTTQFRTYSNAAVLYTQLDNGFINISGNSYDDFDGVPQGYVEVIYYFGESFNEIFCQATAYANAVSVNRATGQSSIKFTADPTSSDCQILSGSVSSQLIVNLSGKSDRSFSFHFNGNGTTTLLGTTDKYNSQQDGFGETFTGTNGFMTGTFQCCGEASTEHRTQLQKQ